jgi:hypothetical protein
MAGKQHFGCKNPFKLPINQKYMESTATIHKSLKQDMFEGVDFYQIDDLLTEEHILIRSSIRDFVKKEISPYIEDWAQKAHFPYEIVKKFGDVGAFGPQIPEEYGGGGLDYISYGSDHAGNRKGRFRDAVYGLCPRFIGDVSHL